MPCGCGGGSKWVLLIHNHARPRAVLLSGDHQEIRRRVQFARGLHGAESRTGTQGHGGCQKSFRCKIPIDSSLYVEGSAVPLHNISRATSTAETTPRPSELAERALLLRELPGLDQRLQTTMLKLFTSLAKLLRLMTNRCYRNRASERDPRR